MHLGQQRKLDHGLGGQGRNAGRLFCTCAVRRCGGYGADVVSKECCRPEEERPSGRRSAAEQGAIDLFPAEHFSLPPVNRWYVCCLWVQPDRVLATDVRSRGGAGLGCMLDVLLRTGVGTARGRSLFSRGYVRFGEGQTPGRRIFVDCPFLGCCGCLRRCAGQAVVRTAGPVGLCLCRCDLCSEFTRPLTAGVLDDSVLPGAGEVNRNGDLLMELLCGEGVWAMDRDPVPCPCHQVM